MKPLRFFSLAGVTLAALFGFGASSLLARDHKDDGATHHRGGGSAGGTHGRSGVPPHVASSGGSHRSPHSGHSSSGAPAPHSRGPGVAHVSPHHSAGAHADHRGGGIARGSPGHVSPRHSIAGNSRTDGGSPNLHLRGHQRGGDLSRSFRSAGSDHVVHPSQSQVHGRGHSFASPNAIAGLSSRSGGNHHVYRSSDPRSSRGRAWSGRDYGSRYSGDRSVYRDGRGFHGSHFVRDWDRASDWCPDRDWAWHHRHRFFWNGLWVTGFYPCYGYDPVDYVYDPRPVYPVSSTVVAVQQALAGQGYYDGAIDGICGPGTRNAIADYQSDHGLPVSGLIDDELMRYLGLI